MAQFPPIGGTKRLGPSLRRAIMIDSVRGQARIRKWPKGRKISPTSKTGVHNRRFRAASWFIKYLTAREHVTVANAVAGSPLMPRDVFFMLLFLRLYQLGPGGAGTIYSMATRKDVSDSLDALANTPGQTLIRGAEFWEGGSLTTNPPTWWWTPQWVNDTPAVTTGPYAFKGGIYTAFADVLVNRMACNFHPAAGDEYEFRICALDASLVVTEMWKSTPIVAGDSNYYPRYFDIAAQLLAGTRYAFMIGRTDGAGTFACPVAVSTSTYWPLPLDHFSLARIANADPDVGDTIDTNGMASETIPMAALVAV